jgi:hypothetical protein
MATNSTKTPHLITRRQVAFRWQCSIGTIKRRERDGSLPSYRIGNRARYALEDVERFEQQACTSTTTRPTTVSPYTPEMGVNQHTYVQ